MNRAELSKKNKYYISKYRYYELKYFCLQYFDYKRKSKSFDGYTKTNTNCIHTCEISNPTERCVESRENYIFKMQLIEHAAAMTDPILKDYILIGVTSNLSYEKLKARTNIPSSKGLYYELYHKFFYMLHLLLSAKVHILS